MPSRIRKSLRRKTIKKNKKLRKRITKMRGGAAAIPTLVGCFTPSDSQVVQIGMPDLSCLSQKPYGTETPYSDHAPIIYNFAYAPLPLKNEYMNIITWNVGQWGNYYDATHNTYNHKFNMQRLETKDEYKKRLVNIIYAIENLLDNNNPSKGTNHPFLFCQELPFISKEPNSQELRDEFKRLLSQKSLGLLCDSSERNEFGLIVKLGSQSQRFTVLNKDTYWDSAYSNGKLIFPHSTSNDKEWRRFEIYFYEFGGNTYYYVNIHALYTEEPATLINFLNRIVDTIQVYRSNNGLGIDNVIIYIIGDYNYNIAAPALNQFIASKKPNNPFANPYLQPKRIIKNMYKITTQNAKGYSLIDNDGNMGECNIDCILKLDLESA